MNTPTRFLADFFCVVAPELGRVPGAAMCASNEATTGKSLADGEGVSTRSPEGTNRWVGLPVWMFLSLTIALAHGVPWIAPAWFPLGWIGIAAAIVFSSTGLTGRDVSAASADPDRGLSAWRTGLGLGPRWWSVWSLSTVAIAIAFYWSPAAMAYTLAADYWVGVLVSAPLMLWDGLRLALAYWIGARVCRDVRHAWLPTALVAIILEHSVPGVFPWSLGLIQLPIPWLLQGVDVLGRSWATLIAFAVAGVIVHLVVAVAAGWSGRVDGNPVSRAGSGESCSGFLARAIPHRFARIVWSGPTLILIFNATYCFFSLAYWHRQIDQAVHARIGLVQVDPSFTDSNEKLRNLSNQIGSQVDLVCWPESSAGTYDLSLSDLADSKTVFRNSRRPDRGLRPWPEASCALLVGGKNYTPDAAATERVYTTAMLIEPDQRISGRYHKRFLMPMGEYVPMEDYVPGLTELFDLQEIVTPGERGQVFSSASGTRLGVMLCYEDMVPAASRESTLEGANVLVSLINGSSFEDPTTLSQHRMLSQLRAIECRRYFLRVAATGETCVISPTGEIDSRLPLQTDGALVAEVALCTTLPPGIRFPKVMPFVALVALAVVMIRNRRHGESKVA